MIVNRGIVTDNPTVAEIHLPSFRENVRKIKSQIGKCRLLAVIKTNAYGHGTGKMAMEAVKAGADRLGVTTVQEGIHLRQQGITLPIHILSSVPIEQADLIVKYDLIPSVSTASFVIALDDAARNQRKKVIVHAKLNTGLNRFGIEPKDALSFFQAYYHLPHIEWEGIYTHFSHADEGDWKRTEDQFNLFIDTVNNLETNGFVFPLKHAGASTITLERPDMYLDMVRPGIALFGYTPDERQERILPLQPVLTLKTKLTLIRNILPGSPVGYGGKYVSAKNEKIGILPIGHGDGFKRSLSNRGEVLIHGKRAPIIGTIALDQTFVNITDIIGAKEGDEVILIGSQGNERITARELANSIGSNVDEVLASLMQRIPRKYILN